jgi:hypothetical protein
LILVRPWFGDQGLLLRRSQAAPPTLCFEFGPNL